MTDMIGHNSGEPADLVRAQLSEFFETSDMRLGKSPKARLNELVESAGRCSVTDNDTTGKAGDLIAMMERFGKMVDDQRTALIQPHVAAVKGSRGYVDRLLQPLHEAIADVRQKISDFRDEQRRRARQQQEEQAKLVAERAAEMNKPAPAPEPTPIKLAPVAGDFGSRVSDRDQKRFSWKDPRKVDKRVFDHPKVKEAMQQACRQLSAAGVKLTGVTVDVQQKTTVRK